MSTDNKKGFLARMQNFMASYRGKVILNYAYSWGAAIVILGTLFKLTHLPGANYMLWIGMGTEVLVFFVSAFDLPVFRTSQNIDASQANIKVVGAPSSGNATLAVGNAGGSSVTASDAQVPALSGGQTIIYASGSGGAAGYTGSTGGTVPAQGTSPASSAGTESVSGTPYEGSGQFYGGGYSGPVSNGPAVNVSPEMEEATTAYLQQLKEMTEMMTRFTTQAESLSQDTEQMNVLNRNLSGINAIYEVQLRNVSSQIGTVEQVHEQTRKLARQLEELNAVYTRMLEAMNPGVK